MKVLFWSRHMLCFREKKRLGMIFNRVSCSEEGIEWKTRIYDDRFGVYHILCYQDTVNEANVLTWLGTRITQPGGLVMESTHMTTTVFEIPYIVSPGKDGRTDLSWHNMEPISCS